ncbi:MAG: hypothetical protein IJ637_09085 [Prevotella sp.]|nr:hypothetical protein [Prevotella sp.]
MMTALVTSCSNDSGGGSLDTPALEEASALYRITDTNADYSSIEFTASGNYIITKNAASSYAPRRIAAVGKRTFGFIPQLAGITRSSDDLGDDGVIYGRYTKNGDTYTLEGFGTITIVGGGSNAVELDITRNDGTKMSVGAQKQSQYSSSDKTNRLCRTWEFAKIRVRASGGGESYDRTYNDYGDFIKAMWAMEGFDESDSYYETEYKEMMAEKPEQVIFTKSGTYVVKYSNGTLAVSTWAWQDEAKGIARYSWSYDTLYSPDDSGELNVSFEGSQLVITENWLDEYDEEEMAEYGDISATITYYMKEVK